MKFIKNLNGENFVLYSTLFDGRVCYGYTTHVLCYVNIPQINIFITIMKYGFLKQQNACETAQTLACQIFTDIVISTSDLPLCYQNVNRCIDYLLLASL